MTPPPPPPADTELQLRRDGIFCQALVAAVCAFSEQLLAALSYRYNNNGEYEESSRDASHKWLEQVAATGVLLHCQSLLSPAVVSGARGGRAPPSRSSFVHSQRLTENLLGAPVLGIGDPALDTQHHVLISGMLYPDFGEIEISSQGHGWCRPLVLTGALLPPGGTRQRLETFSVDEEEVLVSGV